MNRKYVQTTEFFKFFYFFYCNFKEVRNDFHEDFRDYFFPIEFGPRPSDSSLDWVQLLLNSSEYHLETNLGMLFYLTDQEARQGWASIHLLVVGGALGKGGAVDAPPKRHQSDANQKSAHVECLNVHEKMESDRETPASPTYIAFNWPRRAEVQLGGGNGRAWSKET